MKSEVYENIFEDIQTNLGNSNNMSGSTVKIPKAKYTLGEENVSINFKGQKIIGTINYPRELSNVPMVLILHGHEGSRHEMSFTAGTEGIFDKTARVFAEQGLGSLRIDFVGSGDSDGKWEDTLVSDQIEEALDAVDYIKTLRLWNGKKIALLGLSQGGLVSCCVAGRSIDVGSVVLWSPVSNPQFTYPIGIYGLENVINAVNSKDPKLIMKVDSFMPVKAQFLQDVFMISPTAEIRSYKGPLQVVVGLNDEVVNPQPIAGRILLKYHEGENEIIELRDTDHMLNTDKLNYSSCDLAILKAIEFFSKHLVNQ